MLVFCNLVLGGSGCVKKMFTGFEDCGMKGGGRYSKLKCLSIDQGQGRRKYLKLGGHDTLRAPFSSGKGAFPTNKKGTSCLLQTLGGTCPQCPPVPSSMIKC